MDYCQLWTVELCCYLLLLWKRPPTLPVAPLEINGNNVNQVNEYKYLGVIVSSDMSWSSHIPAISSTTRKCIGDLCRKLYLCTCRITYQLFYICTSHWFTHTLNMLVVFGVLTWKKTLRCLRVFRSLGWKFAYSNGNVDMRNSCISPSFHHFLYSYNMVNRLATFKLSH